MIFSSEGFMPHGFCFQWTQYLLSTFVISDSVIFLSYVSISAALFYFSYKRADVRLHWILLLFSSFILSCGLTHLIDVIMLWLPFYWISSIFKSVTAIVSLITAIVLWPLIPKALRVPSIDQLENEIRQKNIIEKELIRLKSISDERFQNIYKSTSDAMIFVDIEGKCLECNEAALNLFEYSESEMLQHTLLSLSSDTEQDSNILKSFLKSIPKDHFEWKFCKKDKSEFVTSVLLTDIESNKVHIQLVSIHDITKIKEQQLELERIAHHDPLTGLPNRILLYDRLHQAISHNSRHNYSFAIAYVDLDGFKEINDTYGHEAGDEVLKIVSGRMLDVLRDGDSIARLGGDEFVIILTDLVNSNICKPILKRILTILNYPIYINDYSVHISASIGVSIFPNNGNNINDLIRNADHAMYFAKQSGKNQCHFYKKCESTQKTSST